MRIVDQEFQLVTLDGVTDRLKEHPKNPKRGNMAAIHESVNVNGFYGAIVAQTSSGYILAGNHRYRAAVQQGAGEVPVLWLDVDDETALRILLGDNRIADLGDYDEAALDSALAELDNLEGTGYGLSSLEQQIEEGGGEGGGGDFHLHPGDVPEDDHESQFGVVVMCEDAEHQESVYQTLQKVVDGEIGRRSEAMEPLRRIELRVVAI